MGGPLGCDGCSPLGPGTTPPSPVAAALSSMPLAWGFSARFGPFTPFGGGFTSGGPPPVNPAAATSSGGGMIGGSAFVSRNLVSGPFGQGFTSGGPPPTGPAAAVSSGGGMVGGSAFAMRAAPSVLGIVQQTIVQAGTTGPNAFSSGSSGNTRDMLGRLSFPQWALMGSMLAAPLAGVATSLVVNVTVTGGGSVPANSGTTLTVTVPGVLSSDSVYANQTSATFAAGLSIVNAFASGAGQITLELLNCTTTSKSIPTNFPLRVGILRG